jgi:hypothetical protein
MVSINTAFNVHGHESLNRPIYKVLLSEEIFTKLGDATLVLPDVLTGHPECQ